MRYTISWTGHLWRVTRLVDDAWLAQVPRFCTAVEIMRVDAEKS